jgi:Kef-type K+ transport system membrane component KefB
MDGIQSPSSLALIAAAAVLAPILAELIRRPRIPGVLFELLLGILIGPHVLDWAEITPFIDGLSTVGLAFLFFLAGFEIDFQKLRGIPMRLAVEGWIISLVLGLLVGGALAAVGFAYSGFLIGLVVTTTAIGTLMPILRDRGLLPTRFGALTVAAGAVGEFAPILAITLLLSGKNPIDEAALLVVFVLLALGVAYIATRPQPHPLVEMMQRHMSTSSQLPVRIAVLMLTVMVVLAADMGLDTLLGAFAAGMLLRVAMSPEQRHDVEPRLVALGFGFLIPIFFVVSGMNFDADALFSNPDVLVRVPLFFGLFLVVRGLPALWVYRDELSARGRAGLAFLQATALPLVVVITEIGLETGHMKPKNATALVGAAMLSVLVFPLLGFGLAQRDASDDAFAIEDPFDG